MEMLDRLIAESERFSDCLADLLEETPPLVDNERAEACFNAAVLSFEHAHGIRTLFSLGAPNSASALLRVQYECLLRGAWVMYAASELQLGKLTAPLTREASDVAKNARNADEMLKDLEAVLERTPTLKGLVLPLREIRNVSWTAMNSFAHGGLHPLKRSEGGFPVQLAADLLKNSSAMLHMAARLLARLTSSADLVRAVEMSYLQFQDCLPAVQRPATPQA
jgi:hypothetical protein